MEKTFLNGLWVPAAEKKRFATYGEFDGRLRIDTHKVARSVGYCRERRRALDVGAHIGAVSVFLASQFEHVEAFEAIPETFEFLELNTSELGNVDAHNVAVADKVGELTFEFVASHGQLSHVLREGDTKFFPDKGEQKLLDGQVIRNHSRVVGPIPSVPIDQYGFDDVSFIKIDVEGAELEVVRGAAETIQRCRPIIMMEQAGNESLYHGRKEDEASVFLRELGMKFDPKYPHAKDKLFRFKG